MENEKEDRTTPDASQPARGYVTGPVIDERAPMLLEWRARVDELGESATLVVESEEGLGLVVPARDPYAGGQDQDVECKRAEFTVYGPAAAEALAEALESVARALRAQAGAR